MSNYVISQILVGLAFVFDVLSFQFKKREAILICFVGATLSLAIHFILIEIYTAGFLFFLASLRFGVAYFSIRKVWMYVFSFLSLIAFTYTYDSFLSVVALVATLAATAAGFQADDKRLRLWMMFSTSCWVYHNLLVGSPAAVFLEVFFLISNIVGFWRYYLRKTQATAVE